MRRRTLLTGAAATAAAAANLLPSGGFAQAKTQTVNLQLGWLAGNNNIGEVAAKQLGYFEEEKLNVVIQPGGPSIDGVAIVASGRHEIGQVSSSPSLMLAASQKIPVKCFATGLQQHPYTFFSLEKKPIRTPKDMVGKKIGIQATGKILLTALLKKHNIPEKDVEVVVIGSDLTPLLTGQIDAVTGWLTSTTAIKGLGQPTGRPAAVGCRRAALCAAALRHQGHDREEARDARRLPQGAGEGLGVRAEGSREGRRPAGQGVSQLQARRRARGHQGAADLRLQRQHQGQRLGRVRSQGVAGPDHALRRAEAVHRRRAQARRRDHDVDPRATKDARAKIG